MLCTACFGNTLQLGKADELNRYQDQAYTPVHPGPF